MMLAGLIVYSNNQSSVIAVHTNQISNLELGQKDLKGEMNARFDKSDEREARIDSKIDQLIAIHMKSPK
jgi:CII-binding regulator of phage lambda lysogenization HflD